MDFLRLHLPGLHQALRGALDSLNTFVSYLIGDEVPTVERKEACAAKELREVAAGRPLGKVEEEAQEALEGLGGSQSTEDGGLRQPGETGRCWEESSAIEQTSGGGEGSSRGSQAERHDTGDWEAAKAIRCQDSGIPLEARKKSEAGQDRRGQALESQEHDEQEVKREETLRTWEREEEEVRATEPGMAGGVESERAWHKEPEGKAGADGHKVAGGGKESEQVVSEAAAEEIQGPGAKGAGREEGVVVVRYDRSPRALGTQEPGAESEDGEASGREEADLPGVEEAEYGAVPEKRIPEGTGRVWALEETSKRDQEEEEVDENRETEVSLFPEQTQVLGTRRVEAEAKGQAAGRETEEGPRSVGEVREGFEGQADGAEEEAVGRQGSEVKAGQASLKEMVQTEEAEEQKRESRSAAEAELPQAKVANEAKGDADLEATPEARPQQFNGRRGEKETQTGDEALEEERGGLEHTVTGGQEPELMGGPQTTTEQLEEGPVGKEELQSLLALSREETERSLQEYPRHVGHVKPNSSVTEAWENIRKDVERDDAQEEKGDAEEREEEATRGQASVVEAAGGRELARPAIPEAGGEWMEAWHGAEEAEAPGAENQEQGRRHGAEAGTSQFLGELDIRETQEEEVEAPGPFGEDRPSGKGWRLEAEALSPQSSESPEADSLAVEMVEDKAALDGGALGPGEEPKREAGDAFGRGWDSEGREEAHRGELVEAAEGEKGRGQEFGLEGSAEEEVPGQGSQAEAPEATLEGEPEGEVTGLGESAGAEGICEVDDFPSGSQALRAEDLPGGQALWEGEAGAWRAREQGQSGEGQRGNQHPEEGKAQRPLDVEDAGVTGGQKAEAAETDPDGLEDIQGLEDVQALEDQSTNEGPAEAEPGPRGEADRSAGQDADGKWGEALLPGSRLDVSVSRSRVFLSRSSSQRRSRPSFRRTPGPEPPEEPPSPPPEEEPSAPERRIQPEQPPEPRPPRPEGTPLPARRSPLGQGFGLAHPGMMQELRARLGQPKPQ